MSNDFNNIISNLEGSCNTVGIFVPSLNREVKFKVLNAKQHKEILSSALDNIAAGVSFSITLSECIIDNCIEKVELVSTDKSYVAVALRSLSLSKECTIDGKIHDLDQFLSKKDHISKESQDITISDDNLKIKLSIPTLNKDIAVNKETQKKIKSSNSDEKNRTRESIGEMYTNEFIKYIISIELNVNGEAVVVELNSLTHSQKQRVVERIPLSIANKIMSYIANIKDIEKKFLALDGQSIDLIDPSFFTI